MIAHALSIVISELSSHLTTTYGADPPQVSLGNLAEGLQSNANNLGGIARDLLYLSLVNIKEEKALKNVANYVRDDIKLTASYENPPAFLNFQILLVATHGNYLNALSALSRAIRFFQFRNSFTQDTVAPESITASAALLHPLDRLESFRLIFDLYSPSMEEVNHLWGTLGGKQYPFVMYMLRMLDLKFKASHGESGLITEVVNDFRHRPVVAR